jgi:hypothetical protein
VRDDEALQLVNQIMGRLLDGWRPSEDLRTWQDPCRCSADCERFDTKPMSPAQAAIIRQHQERGQ